jgi:hypothetical protein
MSEPAAPLPPPAGGCLTAAQISEVQAAAPGKVKEALARHLASCERCQARALFGSVRPAGQRRPMPEPPSLGRAVFLVALVLAAAAFFFWSLAKLTGRIE